MFVYLFPAHFGRGPSFKVDSSLFAESTALGYIAQNAASNAGHRIVTDTGAFNSDFQNMSINENGSWELPRPVSQNSKSVNFSAPGVQPSLQEPQHLFLPLEFDEHLSAPEAQPRGDDLELIVLYRNFMAFLLGGALVSTPRQVTLYSIFMGISSILKRYTFTNLDGATYGQVAASSFARYCDELRLADVRTSREKTIEAIVLGEHMRSWSLYNEGFVHAAGRLDDIKYIKSPKFNKISPITLNRLERAHLDVEQRLLTVRTKLEDFDFPSMFAGIGNSQVAVEAKMVSFPAWKTAFLDFRRFTVSQYRRKYGAWPPKASSKKNNFEESGLNRVLLKEVYKDFTDLYDMLVNRTRLTTRAADMLVMLDGQETGDTNEAIEHALRRIESEYDQATPPVAPPIPYDVPLLPSFSRSSNRSHMGIGDKTVNSTKRLKGPEVSDVLLGSYNRESSLSSPWVQEFIQYERRCDSGKTINEIIDIRCGQWLFLYAVLQTLPMTVVDARDVQFTNGVEYFLCMAPQAGKPWMKEDTSTSRSWYNVANGGGIVSLPTNMIDHSVEGIYRRSHCWTVATKWVEESGQLSPVHESAPPEGLPAPPDVMIHSASGQVSTPHSPYLSPAHSPMLSPQQSPIARPHARPISGSRIPRSNRSSMALGLEAMAAPPQTTSRPVSTYNPNLTFDDILGKAQEQKPKGKKSKK